MMKKMMLCSLLAAVLLLAGCAAGDSPSISSAEPVGQVPSLMEADVTAAYEKAAEAYDWFNLCTMTTAGDAVEQDGLEFQPVDNPDFPTLSALEDHLKTLFSDELTAELLSDEQYRDIDGTLYCAEAGRGSNIYMMGKTVSAAQTDADCWTVTLTFFADSYDMERPDALIGYSQRTLDYAYTDGRWCFTSFCPSDDLDLDAETVFEFTYDWETFDTEQFDAWSSLRLACWQLHSDGAFSEWPSDILSHRVLTDTDNYFSLMALFFASPWETASHVYLASAYNAFNWFSIEEQAQFKALLDMYLPKSEREKAVLDALRSTYAVLSANPDFGSVDPKQEFSLSISGKLLTLGPQAGSFPWDYDLIEVSRSTDLGNDFGTGYEVDCGIVQLRYVTASDGVDYLTSMATVSDHKNGVWTPRIAGCSDYEETLRMRYPNELTRMTYFSSPNYEMLYIYEPGGEGGCMHIAFYIREDKVAKIEVVNLVDSSLLPE